MLATKPETINERPTVAVIGGGPAGLMAAELLSQADVTVHLYDGMPSLGRKLLLAGKGGLNLTHSEPIDPFLGRYGARRAQIEPLLTAFSPDDLREWVHGLGIGTFVGSSGRVFPDGMKAAPLLRRWVRRLQEDGVQIHVRHRWLGWDDAGLLRFAVPEGEEKRVSADALVLALGGGSWAKLGSDGAWVSLLAERGVQIERLRPSNCGFDVPWSDHFQSRFAGMPLKSVVLSLTDQYGATFARQGEFVITTYGVEGSLIYAFSAQLRDEIEANGRAIIHLDLLPQRSLTQVTDRLAKRRGSRSMSSHLQSRLGLKGVKVGLLHEIVPKADFADIPRLAEWMKALPLALITPRPLDEAISSAGGVSFTAVNEDLMLSAIPGVFCAGEMLDWEAPTGGYLLTACFASGRVAGQAVLDWLITSDEEMRGWGA